MSPRVARWLWGGLAIPGAVLADLVLGAGPAGAHNVSAGSLPAPSWLLGYIGAFAVVATAIALRSSWPRARLRIGLTAPAAPGEPVAVPAPPRPRRWAPVGHGVGLLLLGLVLFAAIVGPNENAANIAPVTVFVVWWVGLPILCLVAGDVMRTINPFVPIVALVERLLPRRVDRSASEAPSRAPDITAAAFLWVFSWFFLAYHSPGSPRSLAVLLVVYSAAAVAGGVVWGRAWLAWGEGFAGISRAVAHLVRPRDEPPPPGLVALGAVWIGATAFDSVSSTTFWIDVEGATAGWGRTAVNTLGLVWLTGLAAVIGMAALRVIDGRRGARPVDDGDDDRALDSGASPWPAGSPAALLGLVLVPMATAWFIAHDLTFLLFEGQNFFALLSDPLGRGWDLFGTIDHTIDYRIVTAGWVRWVQLGSLLVGHTVAVVLAHDGAVRLLGRRRGMRVTWTATAVSGLSIVGAALLVLK